MNQEVWLTPNGELRIYKWRKASKIENVTVKLMIVLGRRIEFELWGYQYLGYL